MRRILTVTILTCGAAVGLSLGACGQQSSSPSANMSTTCYYEQTQNPAATVANNNCNYNYSATQGFTNYNSASYGSYASYGQASGCSASQTIVYSASKGLGCVTTAYVTMYGTPAEYAIGADGNFDPINGTNATTTYTGYSTSSAVLLRACDSNDGCPSPQTCRALTSINPNSLGICYLY